MASETNTKKTSTTPLLRANPTAVPRKGAEQGVASSVANAPSKKLALNVLPLPAFSAIWDIRPGSIISYKPHVLAANKVKIITMKVINTGC